MSLKQSLRPLLLCFAVFCLVACGEKSPETARKELAKAGVEYNADTLVMMAEKGESGLVLLFMQAGMSPSSSDKNGKTALMAAAERGDAKMVTSLLQRIPVGQRITITLTPPEPESVPADPKDDKQTAEATPQEVPAKPEQMEVAVIDVPDKEGRTALMYAVTSDKPDIVQALLAHQASPYAFDEKIDSPLHYAARTGNTAVGEALIAAEAEYRNRNQTEATVERRINTKNLDAQTPLMLAVTQGKTAFVQFLIAKGADINLGDRRDYTPLMAAAEAGNIELMKILIAAKATIDIAELTGHTPLSYAITSKNLDGVKLLIDAGAKPSFTKDGYPSPLQLAMSQENPDNALVSYLVEKSTLEKGTLEPLLLEGIKSQQYESVISLLEKGADPNTRNNQDETALNLALQGQSADIAQALVDKGADFSTPNKANVMPLESAVKKGFDKVAVTMLQKGANSGMKTTDGYSLTEMAVYRGLPETLDLLLKSGGNLNMDFALIWSIRDGEGRAVPTLLDHGANPNVLNSDGDPALWLASAAGQKDAVLSLLAHKAEPNLPSKRYGYPAISIAAHFGQAEIVDILINHGAKFDAQDRMGITPLGHAASELQVKVVELLLQKGANPNVKDSSGRSPLDLAAASHGSPARDRVMSVLNAAMKKPAP